MFLDFHKKSQPSIKIGNANIRKKQPLIHWGVHSMRAGLFFFHSHISSVWSIAEAQLQELTVNRAYWKIHHEVGPFFFFYCLNMTLWKGRKGTFALRKCNNLNLCVGRKERFWVDYLFFQRICPGITYDGKIYGRRDPRASASPSGSIAPGGKGVLCAVFSITAQGVL